MAGDETPPFAPAAPPPDEWPPRHWFDSPFEPAPLPPPGPELVPGPAGVAAADMPPIAAPDFTPPPPPPPPEAPGVLGAINDAGKSALGPALGTTIEPIAPPPPAPGDNPLGEDFLRHQEQKAEDLPLPSEREDAMSGAIDERAGALAHLSPEALAGVAVKQGAARNHELAQGILAASDSTLRQAAANLKEMQDGQAEARAKTAQVNADAAELAKTKIDTGIHGWRAVLGALSAFAGGLVAPFMGGRNVGLEQLNKAIENSIDAQKTELATKTNSLTGRRSAIADELAKHGDLFRAQEAFRLAAYDSAIRELQVKAQDYDPRGSTALSYAQTIQQIVGARQQHNEAIEQTNLKNEIETKTKNAQIAKDYAEAEKARAEAGKLNRAGVGGAGGASNTSYNVATGIMSPYLDETGKPIPLMGTKTLDVKGHEKEFANAQAQVDTYGHVQDYLGDLAHMGADLDGARKSLSESAYSKFRSTKAAEFDSDRHALVVYMTKELGDKLTQGQIDEQIQRIPERASIFESRDPMKQIADAQEQADRDFSRSMNVLGANAAPIIAASRRRRAAAPAPRTEDQVGAAQELTSTARTPGDRKDAAAAYDAAKERVAGDVERRHQAEAAAEAVKTFEPALIVDDADPVPAIETSVKIRNEAADTYNQRLTQYHKLRAEKAEIPKRKGDAKEALRKHDEAIAEAAQKVMDAKGVLDNADADWQRAGIANAKPAHGTKPEFH